MYKLIIVSLVLLESVNLSEVSYYEILGVSKQATTQEIRQAYKKLAVKLHPDKTSNKDKQEKFIKITEAYETLKDADKRRDYDVYGTFDTFTRKYDYRSQSEYNNLFYNGLYHDDPFVDTLSGSSFYSYLNEGFHFINFYSPFCPPCQNLVDHWKKLAEKYKGIVKVGAVNCKYQNTFCYNSMRIGSYPSLLFYPNGKHSNSVYYRGERTFEALDQFVMAYLKSRVHIPSVGYVRSRDKPMAYVLGPSKIERGALTRIAYLLNGIVNVVLVDDDTVRGKLTQNEYATVVLQYKEISREIESTEEKEVLREIVEALPKIDLVGPEELKDIRNQLRSGSDKPWVLYFSAEGDDRLLLYQMRVAFPDMYFGEIDCDKWGELCASLQVEEAPAWAVLKAGGAYQRAETSADARSFIHNAAAATNLHSLSASDLTRILDGSVGTWVILVAPHQLAWEHMTEPFTQTSQQFVETEDISFGIMACTASTNKYCRQLADQPAIVIQNGRKRQHYNGKNNVHDLTEFIRLMLDSEDLELDERQVLEILDASSREHSWLVAFLPAGCGRLCDDLAHEWRLVSAKLRPLDFVRVGVLACSAADRGFCANVRSPTARLYPLASGQHYTVSLQHLSQAPYILEWALGHLDDSMQKLDWNAFMKNVAVEDLRPTSGRKPWLIYYHSPRCYRCYEMFADFAIAGIHLHNALNIGKVNCVAERSLCQHQHITSYPSIRLYLNRNQRQTFSSVVSIQVNDYIGLLQDIKPHLKKYDESILDRIDDLGVRSQGIHMKHDEF